MTSVQHVVAQQQAGALQCVCSRLELVAGRGEQMQLAKILGMLDRGDIQRTPRIVGLMLDDGDAVDRGQEILGFGIARGARRSAMHGPTP